MPLSDRERKQLEELESDLAAEDPRLAEELSSGSVGVRFRRSTYVGAVAGMLGIVLLIAGVNTQLIVVGIAGFLLMGIGTYLLFEGHKVGLRRRPELK
ncbi:DUF3040 domain-containing protein [Pseudarthrobacter sp. DSP2-3-2b1]|uniref:DUF3040 domain-containing protein n=1 Tax=Pseudarthrobacter sp. DSP2-3-2b1 TaxID=2804661 RepID=UPI003CE6F32B